MFNENSYSKAVLITAILVFAVLLGIIKTTIDKRDKNIMDKCLKSMDNSPICEECKRRLFSE